MPASDDWELPRQAVLTPPRNDEVAQRTFWGTLVAGTIVIATIVGIVPRAELVRKPRAVPIQVAASEPVRESVARHEDSAAVSEPANAQLVSAPAVAAEPVEATPIVVPAETQPEIVQSTPSAPETIPEPVLLPEYSVPAALVAESVPAPAAEIISAASVAQPPVAIDESPAAHDALDGNDSKPRVVDVPHPGPVTTLNAIAGFSARRYTLTCPHCRAQQTEAADCIADHSSFRCLSCDAKIRVRELHERLENEQKHARKLARR